MRDGLGLVVLAMAISCSSSDAPTDSAPPAEAGPDVGVTDAGADTIEPATDAGPADAPNTEAGPTFCAAHDGCAADEYCDLWLGCEGEPAGSCIKKSDCPEVTAQPPPPPVCGCDGQSYGSRCVAFSYAKRVAHEGPCDKPNQLKTCEGLELQYKIALHKARQCAGIPAAEACQQVADHALGMGCGCPVRVTSRDPLEPIIVLWNEHKCPDLWPGCPPPDCFGPTEPSCMASGLCKASPDGSGGP